MDGKPFLIGREEGTVICSLGDDGLGAAEHVAPHVCKNTLAGIHVTVHHDIETVDELVGDAVLGLLLVQTEHLGDGLASQRVLGIKERATGGSPRLRDGGQNGVGPVRGMVAFDP